MTQSLFPSDPGEITAKRCIDVFYERFLVRHNPPHRVDAWKSRGRFLGDGLIVPRILGAKHGKLFQSMLHTWGGDTVLDLIQEFFTTADPQIVSRGDYSVEWFNMKAQYLLTRDQRLDDVTAHNINAGLNAMGER